MCVCPQTGQSGENLLSLSDAVSQAARTAGVKPITSPEQLQEDLETQELKEAYSDQVREAPPAARFTPPRPDARVDACRRQPPPDRVNPFPCQVKADIKRRVREDSDFNSQQFPNTDRAFSSDS